jgi:calcium-dependent protein kinase
MFRKIDLDGSGTIDYTEFVMATIEEKNLLTHERLRMAFRMFDKDGSGSLSADEIKAVLCFDSTVDPSEIDQIIAEVDENGDGEI